MARLQTVTIKDDNPRGFKIINASDFDPETHERFEAKPEKKKKADSNKEPQSTEPAGGNTNPPSTGSDNDTVIPDDWRSLTWPQLRSLASTVTDKTVVSKEDAVEAIEAYLGDD